MRNGIRTVTLVSALLAMLGLAGCGASGQDPAAGTDPGACPN
ncbi:MAG: hypothetical protein QOI75_1527, partial [Pseudonocardiales bacterium]|nr:hypothetical protein [Pseudonocardiales bacterium]